MDDTINFTKVERKNNAIPFLDGLLIKNNFELEFHVYRKMRKLSPILFARLKEVNRLVNSNNNSIEKLIGRAKFKIIDLSKSEIYEVKCQDGCDFAFIGKIGHTRPD